MNTRTRSALDRMAAQRFNPEELVRDHRSASMPTRLLDELHATSPQPVTGAVTPPPRRITRRRLLVAAGIAAVAAGGSVVAVPRLTGSTAYAATPPLLHYTSTSSKGAATDILTDLAARARRQPPPPGSGPYHYVRTRGWYLHTELTTDMRVLRSGIEPSNREQWVAGDGSGRLNITRNGEPSRLSGIYGPGKLLAGFITTGTVGELRARLADQHLGTGTAGWFTTVNDLWNGQVVPPELQSAVLSILAAQPGVTVRGTTTDRMGREGIAISADARSRHTGTPDMRYILVLDPRTGMLLDYEEVALTASDLPVQAPATIGYTQWLASGYTPTTTERP